MRFASACYNNAHPWDKFLNIPSVKVDHPDQLKEGDILIIHGGGDISPSLYNHQVSKYTGATDELSNRDWVEWNLLQRAIELKLPIIGICRGGQMLCAAAGGSLVQHVENHAGAYHKVKTYDGRFFTVNSIHHQMMNPENTEHKLLASSAPALSNVYHGQHGKMEMNLEPEAILFPKIKGLAIQWHPEMMGHLAPATSFLMEELGALI